MGLRYAYEHEENRGSEIYLTQPVGNGRVIDYTWTEVMGQARRMATHLQSLGFPRGSKIALVSKNCAHFIIAELAIWMAGYTTVALYPTINADTASYILDHSDAVLLFIGKLDTWDEIQQGVPSDLPQIGLPLAPANDAPTWDAIIADSAPLMGQPTREADELSMIVYTSGSTGRPKGVMHSFGVLERVTQLSLDLIDVSPEDRVLSYLPLAHVLERAAIEVGSMVIGFRVYFAESIDTFVSDLRRARPTLFISVPRLWLKFQLGVHQKLPKRLVEIALALPIVRTWMRKRILSGLGLDHVRYAFSGSAPIPADLIAWYRRVGLNLLEGYGMSEDFIYSHRSDDDHNRPGYVGIPLPGVEVKLSEQGEILINSPGKMVGYYKQPELTAESFTEDGFFRTGDRGIRDANGMLKITGRVKELFKTSKGKYISPAPIENLLNNDDHIELSCVTGSGQPQPYAMVVLAEDMRSKVSDPGARQTLTAAMEQLLSQVNATVEHHERLQFLVVITEDWTPTNGLLTPTLKIRRSAIEERYGARVDHWVAAQQRILWDDD